MRAYPYERLPGAVTFRVVGASLQVPGGGREVLDSKASSVIDQVVALGQSGRDDWESARLKISATVPPGAIEPTGPWSNVAVIAVLTERATNARVTSVLTPDAGGGREWVGNLDLRRADHVGRATLAVHVVATVGGITGRMIAESDNNWYVDVDSDRPTRSQPFDIKEVGFRDGPLWLRRFREVPWVVDSSGRLPTVHINTDFEGVTEILAGDGGSMAGTVHELLVAQMATDVWTAVFHTALGDLEVEDDGTPVLPSNWRGEVLREMLPDVMPDLPVEEALRDVHRRRTGASGWVDLQPRIHYAAARKAEVPRALSTAVRDVDRFSRESDA
ncbi:hypothetical protein [Streptomyces sp. NPDC017941]|uniref:hypothetical protein n=1 Tax=Streptomyces sp. NPDC017941 TaxID=3365018 RepID=UPI003789801C